LRPPGYSAFLALVTLGRPDRIPVAKLANDALGALGALLVAALSARIFHRRGLAIAAGALAALHPTLVLVSLDVQSEPLFVALLLSSGYLLLAATDRPSSNLAVLGGAFLALAALTRFSALLLAPLLLAPLWDQRHPRRANAHIAFSALLGFGLVLAPWTLQNALVFGGRILVNDGASYVFYGPRWAVLAVGASMATLFLCAGIGLARAPRTGVSAFCLVFLAATMLHVVLETNWRYPTANWDPVLLLYASYGAATLLTTRPGHTAARALRDEG
jgi:4-amino-4-deoxy-L-arabinose transferase-like glycosyltransferase